MLMLVWTTVPTQADAERLGNTMIEAGLAICVQIDGPITSIYRWRGKIEQSTEFRISFKCFSANLAALEQRTLVLHPYTSPEWIVVRACHVSEKYLSWAHKNIQS